MLGIANIIYSILLMLKSIRTNLSFNHIRHKSLMFTFVVKKTKQKTRQTKIKKSSQESTFTYHFVSKPATIVIFTFQRH